MKRMLLIADSPIRWIYPLLALAMLGGSSVAFSQEPSKAEEARKPGLLKRIFPPQAEVDKDRKPAAEGKGLADLFRGATALKNDETKEVVRYEIRFGGGNVDRPGRLYTTQPYQVTARVVNIATGEQVRGLAPLVRIRLIRDSEGPEGTADARTLFRRVECPGRYVWTIEEPHRGAYHLEATTLDGSELSGRSAQFEIHPPVINVTLPRRDVRIDHGQETSIQWDTRNLNGKVRIELWGGGESARRPERILAEDTENDGSWWGELMPRRRGLQFRESSQRKIVIRSEEAPLIQGESAIFYLSTLD